MPTDFQSATSIHRTRRTHHCEWCKTVIDAGSPATAVRGRYDGDFYAWHVHVDCDEAWKRDPCMADGEGCLYEHGRGLTCIETEDPQRHFQRLQERTNGSEA